MGCSSSKHATGDTATDLGQSRLVKAPRQVTSGFTSPLSQNVANSPHPASSLRSGMPTLPLVSHQQRNFHVAQPQGVGFDIDTRAGPLEPPIHDVWPKRLVLGDVDVVVLVWHHSNANNATTGPTSGWIYLSDGLMKTVGQPEVIFRLRQRPNEAPQSFPLFPLEWIKVVYEFARNGIYLEEGQMCQIVPGDMMRFVVGRKDIVRSRDSWEGATDLRMFVHTSPPGWDGVFDIPPGFKIPRVAHNVVGLTAEEAAVALEFGSTRVIAHLGLSVRCFPTPTWVERDRKDCCTMADQANSSRSNFKIARIFGVHALLAGGLDSGTIILSLPSTEAKTKAIQAAFRNLSQEKIFGLDSFMSQQADAGLTWKSGQIDAQAYTKGSMECVNLSFIGFIQYTRDEMDDCKLMDDGYCLFLNLKSWNKLQQAVSLCEDCTIPLAGKDFRLKWQRPAYRSPFNQPILERFRVNELIVPSLAGSHVRIGGISFIHEPLPSIVSSMALVEYVERVRLLLCDLISAVPPSGLWQHCEQFSVRFQLPALPGNALATRCEPSSAGVDVNFLSNAIMLVPLEFKDTPTDDQLVYLFQVDFALWTNS